MTQNVVATEHNVVNPVSTDANGDVVTDRHNNPASNMVAEILYPSAFNISWAGAGTTNAPATTDYWAGAVGVNNDGATTANVYHVVEIAGSLTWVDTGATVANLYGA